MGEEGVRGEEGNYRIPNRSQIYRSFPYLRVVESFWGVFIQLLRILVTRLKT